MAGEIALKLNLQIKKETLATLQAAFVKLNEVVITPLQIHNANAADRNVGFSFCDAYCEVSELNDEQYKFGGLFINGIKILKDYLRKSPVLPKLPKDVDALERLLNSLEEGKLCIQNVRPELGQNCLKRLSADDNVMSRFNAKSKYIRSTSTCHNL